AGWYAVRDEAFYAESELIDGPGGKKVAPTGADVEWLEEENYFFRLSAWQDRLLAFYEAHPDAVAPRSRRNEVISFVKSGLNDLSISRTSFGWGVPVPGHPGHVVYVWVDALGNFIPPKALIDKYGLDPVRYFLLRELPFGSDGDFSHRAIVGRLNGDLANDYGNLAQRVLSMINRNCDAAVPEPGAFTAEDEQL